MGVGDDGAFGCADEVVVLEEALVGVVFAAFGEGDGGDAAAFVGNLDALAGAEGAAAVDCAGGGGGAAAHGVVLLGWVCADGLGPLGGESVSSKNLYPFYRRLWRAWSEHRKARGAVPRPYAVAPLPRAVSP